MYFKNKQGRVYYEVHGPQAGPVLVFCHGVGMNHETFSESVVALKETYRIITWDMPYHGESSAIDDSLPFSQTAADFVIGILDELQIEKATLIGQSLGSFVIQHVADKYPDRVVATVHIGGGSLYPKYSAWIRVFRPWISLLKIWPDKSLFRLFAKHKALTSGTREYLERIVSQTGKNVLVHLTKEMLDDMVNGISSPLKQPIQLIFGNKDAASVRKLSLKWHSASTNSELVAIEQAHHIANQDNPWEFNRALQSFLERVIQ